MQGAHFQGFRNRELEGVKPWQTVTLAIDSVGTRVFRYDFDVVSRCRSTPVNGLADYPATVFGESSFGERIEKQRLRADKRGH